MLEIINPVIFVEIKNKKFDDDNHEAEVETNSSDKKKHMFLKECN